jgi:hypothetical protein
MDAPDTRKSSAITDHPIEPRNTFDSKTARYIGAGQYSRTPSTLAASEYLCRVCRMAEAAHSETTVKR